MKDNLVILVPDSGYVRQWALVHTDNQDVSFSPQASPYPGPGPGPGPGSGPGERLVQPVTPLETDTLASLSQVNHP